MKIKLIFSITLIMNFFVLFPSQASYIPQVEFVYKRAFTITREPVKTTDLSDRYLKYKYTAVFNVPSDFPYRYPVYTALKDVVAERNAIGVLSKDELSFSGGLIYPTKDINLEYLMFGPSLANLFIVYDYFGHLRKEMAPGQVKLSIYKKEQTGSIYDLFLISEESKGDFLGGGETYAWTRQCLEAGFSSCRIKN